jgi:hypothetical protein
MDRIGTMESLQHGSAITIIIVMVDRVDGRCALHNRWIVMPSGDARPPKEDLPDPKSISYIFVYIELETSSSSTTACHRQQQEP